MFYCCSKKSAALQHGCCCYEYLRHIAAAGAGRWEESRAVTLPGWASEFTLVQAGSIFKLIHLRSAIETLCLVKTPASCERKAETAKIEMCAFLEKVVFVCTGPVMHFCLCLSLRLCNQLWRLTVALFLCAPSTTRVFFTSSACPVLLCSLSLFLFLSSSPHPPQAV